MTKTNDIEKHDRLILKVVDSKLIDVGTEISLNYLGLELNGKSDYNENKLFISHFGSGYDTHDNSSKTNGKLYPNKTMDKTDIDYILPKEDSVNPHHFDIKYDIINKSYYIKNVDESALFVKLNKKLVSINLTQTYFSYLSKVQ